MVDQLKSVCNKIVPKGRSLVVERQRDRMKERCALGLNPLVWHFLNLTNLLALFNLVITRISRCKRWLIVEYNGLKNILNYLHRFTFLTFAKKIFFETRKIRKLKLVIEQETFSKGNKRKI